MSYTKITDPIPGIVDVLAAVLAQMRITEPVAADLLAAGAAVQLETGDKIWLSCVVHDKTDTPQLDFINVAIACRPDVTPWLKPNGQYVAVAWWYGLWPDELARLGIDTARRAMQMILLGEPQPQVPIPVPAEDGPTEMDALPIAAAAASGIRAAITATTEISAPPADVL